MAISGNIFKSANEAKASSGSDDIVGQFRAGFQDERGRPVGLTSWRATTGDPTVADRLHELLEATDEITEWETKTDQNLQVFGNRESIDIILDGPGSIRSSMVLWSQKGGKIIETDGEYIIENGVVTDKPDPDAMLPLAERKEKARNGTGPSPSLQVYFRLADAPELGKFKSFSSSWTAIENYGEAESQLAAFDGPVRATFTIDQVSWNDRETGQEKSYQRPQIEVIGSLNPVAA